MTIQKPPRDEHGNLLCPHCGGRAVLLEDSSAVYGRNYGPIWACRPCEAWVGCHPGTFSPLGTPANKALRTARQKAHGAFDRLWRAKAARERISRSKARKKGYAWLAEHFGVAPKNCHIGWMDEEQCRRVVDLCAPFHATASRALEAAAC